MRFEGTDNYIATDDLKVAVNAAIVLERPLLVKGEPGTGKTVLAEEIAQATKAPLITWHIKSTTKAQQGFTSMMQCRACATANSATRESPTSATISGAASCGRLSPATSGQCC